MYGSFQRFVAESARMQVEARMKAEAREVVSAAPVARDQSEDRKQAEFIVYGKETVVGTRYGVMRTATGEKGPADMSAADAGALIDYIDQCRDELRYSQLAEYAEQRAKSYPVEA